VLGLTRVIFGLCPRCLIFSHLGELVDMVLTRTGYALPTPRDDWALRFPPPDAT